MKRLRYPQRNWIEIIKSFPELCLSSALLFFVFGMIALLPFSSAVSLAPSTDATGDPARGQKVFETRCTGCHALDRNKEGPHLRGVFGRKAGTVPDFKYSDGVKAANFTWDAGLLDRWLTEPRKLIPDAEMDFRVPKAGDRSDVIAYLRQLSE